VTLTFAKTYVLYCSFKPKLNLDPVWFQTSAQINFGFKLGFKLGLKLGFRPKSETTLMCFV